MKRCVKILTYLVFVTFLFWALNACAGKDFELSESYELVAMEYNISTRENANAYGFLLFFSYSSEEETTEEYRYMYKRADGGMMNGIIDSYNSGTVVIYEDDSSTPKLEVWTKGSGLLKETEYRFTIPTGSIVNYYNPQGIDQNQKEKSE